jgi:phosphate transport system protein
LSAENLSATSAYKTIYTGWAARGIDLRPNSVIRQIVKSASKANGVSAQELTEMVSRACLVARDAAFNIRDYIATSSRMALVAVKQCERELDDIERNIDETLPSAITDVTEPEARQLLACLRFITDLERIGDLLYSVGRGIDQLSSPLTRQDTQHFLEMSDTLQRMLEDVHKGFVAGDVQPAELVLKNDAKLDRSCHQLFRRHLQISGKKTTSDNTRVLFIAQALERAGDHAKNLAEEVIHLVQGHTLKHASRTRLRAD